MVCRIRGQRGKRWAAEKRYPATERLPLPPIFSPSLIRLHTSFRRERSERAGISHSPASTMSESPEMTNMQRTMTALPEVPAQIAGHRLRQGPKLGRTASPCDYLVPLGKQLGRKRCRRGFPEDLQGLNWAGCRRVSPRIARIFA